MKQSAKLLVYGFILGNIKFYTKFILKLTSKQTKIFLIILIGIDEL